MTLLERLGTVDDRRPANLGVEPAFDQISISACTTAASRSRLDQAEQMLAAFTIDAEGGHQDWSLPDIQAVNLDDQRSSWTDRCSPLEPAVLPSSAHEPARGRRLRGACPAICRSCPRATAQRAELACRHVDSMRCMAQRPSQFSACAAVAGRSAEFHCRRKPRTLSMDATLPPMKPILPSFGPAVATRPPPRPCGAPASRWASSRSICSMASDPGRQTERSNELSTSCRAI